jgi:hypothetical protein
MQILRHSQIAMTMEVYSEVGRSTWPVKMIYAAPCEPPCDLDGRAACEPLVDDLVKDRVAARAVIDGQVLAGAAADAAAPLALLDRRAGRRAVAVISHVWPQQVLPRHPLFPS